MNWRKNGKDYSTFGIMIPERTFSASSYRFGFNGKEKDDEVKGSGNQQDYGMRIYDGRLGRFLSVDALTKNFPFYTPYQYAGNQPIKCIDMDGLEPISPGYAMNYVFEGFRRYLDAGINALRFENKTVASLNNKNMPDKTIGNTTISSSTKTSIAATIAYEGWDLFKPGQDNTVSQVPSPKLTLKFENQIIQETKARSVVGSFSLTKTNSLSSTGETKQTTDGKINFMTNTEIPGSFSLTSAMSNKTGKTNSATLSVGTDNASIFFKYKQTTNGGSTSDNVSVGAQVNLTSPQVNGYSFSVGNTTEVSK